MLRQSTVYRLWETKGPSYLFKSNLFCKLIDDRTRFLSSFTSHNTFSHNILGNKRKNVGYNKVIL